MTRIVLLVVLIVHTTFSSYMLRESGIRSVFPPFNEAYAYQMFSDITVLLGLVLFMFYREAKRRRRPTWPLAFCFVGMVLLGSIAPLVYLLIEKDLFA